MRTRCLLVLLAVVLAPAAYADGEIEINQASASAGGVNGSLAADPPGFPVVITAPGSYRLTSDLVGFDAIFVNADDVSIDLGGFTIRGETAGCDGPPKGLGIAASGDNLTIRDGRVRYQGIGITSSGAGARIERVQVDHHCGDGIELGTNAIVEAVQAQDNLGSGIRCSHFCRITNTTSYRNGDFNIWTGTDSIVSGSIAADSQTNAGILVGAGSIVVHSAASLNAASGIATAEASNVLGSVANQNGGHGVNLNSTSAAALNELDGNASGGFESGIAHGCNVVNGAPSCPTHP